MFLHEIWPEVETARDEETPDDSNDNIKKEKYTNNYLDKEDEHGNISGDSHSNIELDCLYLIWRNETRSQGHFAAVDCTKHSEGQERTGDVDTNLSTKPELLLFFTIDGDQEENNYNHWARDSGHDGQEIGAASY